MYTLCVAVSLCLLQMLYRRIYLVHGCMLSSINKWIVYSQLQRASGSYTYDSHLLECTYCVCTPGNVVIINTPSDTCEYPTSIHLLNFPCAFPLSSDRDH